MSDYISEAEALADWEDDNCIVEEDEFSFDYPRWTSRYKKHKKKKPNVARDAAGRKAKLSECIENIRATNKQKKKGDTCTCPICGKTFVKAHYQQIFCSSNCHDKYHTLRYK